MAPHATDEPVREACILNPLSSFSVLAIWRSGVDLAVHLGFDGPDTPSAQRRDQTFYRNSFRVGCASLRAVHSREHNLTLRSRTFLPDFYYTLFAFYEPALTTIGFIGTLCDPETAHNAQAPWPSGTSPPAVFPKASVVTTIQLAHVCALMGLLNISVLTAARQHLASQPALQEKIVRALLTPLLIGDVMHLYVTLWALGDDRWDVTQWSPMLWVSVVLGVSLMIPRVMWHLGIWRYVDARDRPPAHAESSRPGSHSEKR